MTYPGYFDYNATTPVCVEAANAFMDAIKQFGNPSSRYVLSTASKNIIENARLAVGDLIGATAEEVFFTSGGTEANNWAIKGAFFRRHHCPASRHMIISAMEHASVLEACAFLQDTFNCEITKLLPDRDGIISAEAVAGALRPDTFLVSTMLVNNEVGSIQPIREIGALLRNKDIHFHVDAVQAVGKIPVRVGELGVDSLSFAGHKFYAPKGVGGLYIKSGVEISPLIHGGGQEQGMRGGTEAVAMAAALGAAAQVAKASMAQQLTQANAVTHALRNQLRLQLPDIYFHGPENRSLQVANTLSFCIPGVRGEALAALLDRGHGVQVSLGSACSNNKAAALSHVLSAMGLGEDEIRSTIRASVGKYTTMDDVHGFVSALATSVTTLRQISSPARSKHVAAA